MNESRHKRVLGNLAGYILGALDVDDRREVESHLEECGACEEEFAALADAGKALAFYVPPIEPPGGLKQRLLDRLELGDEDSAVAESPVTLVDSRPSFISEFAAWFLRSPVRLAGSTALVVGGIAAALTVSLMNSTLDERVGNLESKASIEATAVNEIVQNVLPAVPETSSAPDEQPAAVVASETSQTEPASVMAVSRLAAINEQLQTMMRDQIALQQAAAAPSAKTAFLEGTDPAQDAIGALVAGYSDDQIGMLVVSGLPPTPAGYVYQLWIQDAGIPTSIATFVVDAMGYARIEVPHVYLSDGVISGSLTLEPSGGSQSPSGTKIMRLSAR